MTTLDALADAQRFLRTHPDVAACASVTVHQDGEWSVQLVQHAHDDETRLGMIYGLAATYSGEVVRRPGSRLVSTTVAWEDGRTVDVYTAVTPTVVTSVAPEPVQGVTV